MTQLDIDFSTDDDREARADVWLWCAMLMRVEATELEYQWPRPTGEDLERTHAQLDALEAADERFMAKAAEVRGAEIDQECWERAMSRFSG